jgi:hypothetical protein
LVTLATSRLELSFSLLILQKVLDLTTCDNLSENSRSLLAALMCSLLTLVWWVHYSFISVCDIISWQMQYIIQILTEDGLATTKWNLKFLCNHLYHLVTVTGIQHSLVYVAHVDIGPQCCKLSTVQVVFQEITVIFESVICQHAWTGSRLPVTLLIGSILEVFWYAIHSPIHFNYCFVEVGYVTGY